MTAEPLAWSLEPHAPASGTIGDLSEETVVLFLRKVRKVWSFPPAERGERMAAFVAALPGAPTAEQVWALPPAVRETFWSRIVGQIAGPGWLDAMIRIGELEVAS